MTHQPKVLVVTDPRTFDGTPYAVAERACAQITGLIRAALDIMPETRKMVLNADLERQLSLGQEPDPAASVVTARLLDLEKELSGLRRKIEVIQRAAAYDPKHPPTA